MRYLMGSLALLAVAAAGQTASTVLAADCSAYASIPLPSEAETTPIPKTPPACASYRSYRGIGRPVNYQEARACAWQERLAQIADLGQNQAAPIAWMVGGPLILADIYFNGAGVKRNIPLAMRFACESQEGMVRLALADIAKLNGSLPTNAPFEFCDYAVTTVAMTFCSSYQAEIEDDRRNRYYSSLKSSMAPDQQAAFEKLLAAQKAYIKAHASEGYQGGTIRGIRTIGSQNILNDLFHTDVVHFERKTHTQESTEMGDVTAGDLSLVEEAWQIYRNAWIAFARLRYPGAVDLIGAHITLARYRLLKTIS